MICSGTPSAADSWRTWLLYRSPIGLNAHAESPNSVVYPISDSVLLPVPTTRPPRFRARAHRTPIRLLAEKLPRRSGLGGSSSEPLARLAGFAPADPPAPK